ncbi:hypothetical protein F5Y02DRAFT_208076 [Annulohypoxylon stygium]|nr:hypothetical protein F5Y02DRAFT_208076 [Annulohypoxylon stygium]
MPRKQKITLSTEEERQIRAARKEDRTSWKTGATDEQKATAIDRAFGDKQRYVWMQKPKKPAQPGSLDELEERLEKAKAQRSQSKARRSAKKAGKRAGDKESRTELEKALEEGLEQAFAEDIEKEFEARQETNSHTPASIHPQVWSVEQTNNIRPHLPTPEAYSPYRTSSMAMPVPVTPVTPAGPITPTSIGQTSPKDSGSVSTKRKRGTEDDPIEISSREASPIVIPSRDGTPPPPSQPPAAKKAKTVPSLEEELEAAFVEINSGEQNAEASLSLEQGMEMAFNEISDEENARMLLLL